MPKVIVIGRRADILPFKAVGADIMEVRDASDAGAALGGLAGSVEPTLVMMTEDTAALCPEEVDGFRGNRMNVFMPIPTVSSPSGKRIEEVRALVARALGVDLLGRQDAGAEEK